MLPPSGFRTGEWFPRLADCERPFGTDGGGRFGDSPSYLPLAVAPSVLASALPPSYLPSGGGEVALFRTDAHAGAKRGDERPPSLMNSLL
jgi:hypothetical protein